MLKIFAPATLPIRPAPPAKPVSHQLTLTEEESVLVRAYRAIGIDFEQAVGAMVRVQCGTDDDDAARIGCFEDLAASLLADTQAGSASSQTRKGRA